MGEAVADVTDHRLQPLIALGRSYIRWAVEDPAVARLVFRAGATGPDSVVTPHPHGVLGAELDRFAAAGALPATARPGADFTVWAALHGLAVLLVDGLGHTDDERAADLQAERLVRAVLTGPAQEETPSAGRPALGSAHTRRLAGPQPGRAPATPGRR
ncbi:TetR-like C-terminal domain-containing protein [Streptomyces sp. NPDC048710]|uniref:TetR-like C-terminal domain-containing protein n=1 Tax=Streptomyces sp. NPDC048710 TaxID=3365586 RepID=UPI0037203092